MKKRHLLISLFSALFMALGSCGAISFLVFGLPKEFQDTYVAALAKQFKRLNEKTNERKIILVGGSSTCFGLRSDLFSRELSGFKAVDFGLYISLGTKMMIDLSKSNIQANDLVILAPEMTSQAWSTYFNADTATKALESNWKMFDYLPSSDQQLILSSCGSYVSDKLEYFSGRKTFTGGGVYQNSSINDLGDVCYPRPYNVMTGLVDSTSSISFSESNVSQDFINYVNKFSTFVESRGAKLLLSYAPMNRGSVVSTQEDIEKFDNYIFTNFNAEVISSPLDYIFDPLYFFDSNFHLNDAGAVARTKQLIKDIKRYLSDTSITNIIVPNPPEVPADDPKAPSGTDENAKYFTFDDYKNYSGQKIGVKITGVNSDYLAQSELTTASRDGDNSKVVAIGKGAFSGAKNLQKLNILSSSLSYIEEDAFDGASSLNSIFVSQTNPAKIIVPLSGLMKGAEGCKIYVPKNSLSLYQNDYYWGNYFSYLAGY